MVTDDAALEGAFKTPGLRNVALRAPYMHAGQFASLEEVVAHYAASPAAAVGRSELAPDGQGQAGRKAIRLSESDVRDVAAFLRTLSGPVPERQ
jgi:cytochrome c peroxidase